MKTDWRLPENRREMFLRQYSFDLKHRTHTGLLYLAVPEIAETFDLDEEGRAWLTWLDSNTQNPVTTLLLLEAAPTAEEWPRAVEFWEENYRELAWDRDRRYQKSSFGEATREWYNRVLISPASDWLAAAENGWRSLWRYARSQPYMGRLSAWTMAETARVLLGADRIPEPDTLLLRDPSGSRSHRNGLATVYGLDAAKWKWADYSRELLDELEAFGADLLSEARERNPGNPDASYYTMESSLCAYKSWHRAPGRRYPNVYTDLHYLELKAAEARFGDRFQIFWDMRRRELPEYMRLEDSPYDPGFSPAKRVLHAETGVPPMLHREYPDMWNPLNAAIEAGTCPRRES